MKNKVTYEITVGYTHGKDGDIVDTRNIDITFRPIEEKGKWSLRNITNQIGRIYNGMKSEIKEEIKEDPSFKGSEIFIEIYPRIFEYEDLSWKEIMENVEHNLKNGYGGYGDYGQHVETGEQIELWNNKTGFSIPLKKVRKYIKNDPKAQKVLTAFYKAFRRSFGEDGIPRRKKKK
mgnify:CR=1 FL=1|tara:strand:- start:1131 stop:1658 length:528 start_codon:yes stop_codon:yes gene_type:complete